MRAPRTFSELAERWLDTRANEKRSKADDESMIRKHLRPAFGAITSEHVERYKNERARLSPKTVANHLTLLGTMLRLAVELGWLVSPPIVRKPRVDPDDADQPWLRTDDEIAKVLDAARAAIEHERSVFGCSVRPLQRRAVHRHARGRARGLAMVGSGPRPPHDPRAPLLRRKDQDPRIATSRADRRCGSPHASRVAPSVPDQGRRSRAPESGGEHARRVARVFEEVLHRALDRAAFERPTEGQNKHVIHFRSFRHTFACHWRLRGGSLDDLIRVLGHTSKTMTEHHANIGGHHRPEHFAIFGLNEAPAR